ncbi:MAG: cyanophycinase [Ginsengibacter sp.]
MNFLFSLPLMVLPFTSCKKDDSDNPFTRPVPPPVVTDSRPGSLGIIGDTSDVQTTTQGGVVIMGGGTDVDDAFRWMISRSGGGDVVVIRASGTDAYNPYINALGKVNSVETLKIDSRALANNDAVARIIRNAEMLFIAGGDQSDYTQYWKGTLVMDAINYLLNNKKVPVGGTSAGAAILGNFYFSGERSSVTSETALAAPYSKDITLYKDDFLKAPYLQNVIADQHFSQRDRQGRTTVFLARIMTDWNKTPYGIAVDEKTAVCIDDKGMAEVVGANNAFFLKTFSDKLPETLESNKPLIWNHDGKAIAVSGISGNAKGNRFNVAAFEPANTTGLTNFWWSAIAGKMYFFNN